MLADISGLNLPLLHTLQHAGGFGAWRMSQLFVGTRATRGGRSTLHFDHNDNLFLQVAGVKRFYLYPPTESGNMYAWPVFHALDRRAQVDIRRRDDPTHLAAFPRLAAARCVEVIVSVLPICGGKSCTWVW